MRVAILIPARYKSSRFEGKVIYPIDGKPMLQWVYDGVKDSRRADFVAVLTDNERVFETVKSFGGNVFMVKGDFASGTDRVASFCKDRDFDYIVNMQADEPLIDAETVDKLIDCATKNDAPIATLATPCAPCEVDDANVVKVVVDKFSYAMYFSRSRIPFNRNVFNEYLKHIGIYVYKKDILLRLSELKPTTLEQAEGLEQLRALENGIKVKVCLTDKFLISVDTKEDLSRLLKYLGKYNG